MPKFVSRSIKRKLTMITLLISCVVLFLASVIFVTTQVASYRRAIVQELETITTIIGSNSTAAVVFDDRRAAEEILAALRAKPNIVSARIFLTDGSLFATYMGRETPSHIDAGARSNLPRVFLMPGQAAGHESDFLAGHVDLYAPIYFDDETIGSIFIRSDLSALYATIRTYALIAALVFVLSIGVAYALSARLQNVISQPIVGLLGTMRRVSVEKTYATRAVKHGEDELGELVDGFNAMLAQIQAHDESLRAAWHQAESANRAKSEFLANMSHELRTPLNAILGFSDIIKSELLGPVGTPAYAQYAADIHDSGHHLLDVISDILDVSKVEAGELRLDEDVVDVRRVIEKSVRLVRGRACEAGLELEVYFAPEVAYLRADERLVKQCLINLLSNAVKYTPEGGTVSVTATCLEGAVTISVADTGIGIATHDIPRVLTAFGQVEGAFTRKFEGTGLGLPLAKSFAEAHGGSLALDSTLGVGTTVTIRFPPSRRLERDEIESDPDRPGLPPPLPVRLPLRAKEKLSA